MLELILKGNPPMSTKNMPDVASIRAARAATLRDRAHVVEAAGEPVVQAFRHPSFHELVTQEGRTVDVLAERAAESIFGVGSRDRLSNRTALTLEGAAFYLYRRIEPAWVKAAQEQAVEALLVTDEFRAVTRDRSGAERRLVAHRCVTSMWAAFIGTMENRTSVRPEVYLRVAAAQTEGGAR